MLVGVHHSTTDLHLNLCRLAAPNCPQKRDSAGLNSIYACIAEERGTVRRPVKACSVPSGLSLVSLHLPDQTIPFSAFIDSEADSNYMDKRFARDLNLPTQPLAQPIYVKPLDSHVIHSCSFCTNLVRLSIDNHHEDISLQYNKLT